MSGWLANGLKAEAAALRARARLARQRATRLEPDYAKASRAAADAYDEAAQLLLDRARKAEAGEL